MLAGNLDFWKYEGTALPPVKLAGRSLAADVDMRRACDCNGLLREALTIAVDMVADSAKMTRMNGGFEGKVL